MKQPYVFTFVIGYRHKPDRLNLLRRTLDWINGFAGAEVIVVEQDKHSKISNLGLRCKHIFIKSKMPYNRSWAFNVGLKYAKSNIIVCGDSDLIMHPDDFIKGLQALQEFEMVSPYNSVVDLTPEESTLPLDQILKINRPGRGENDNQKINISGGIAMFRKDALLRIGGWNQNILGWGGEDDFQTIKVKNFLTWSELTSKCYHLFHNREIPDTNYYQRTLQILDTFSKMKKEDIQKHIESSMKTIGMINLYDTF